MMNEEEILKKVLSGRMTGEERKNVSEQDIVVRHLKSQWDDSQNDSVLDSKAKDRVLDRITKRYTGINRLPNVGDDMVLPLHWHYFFLWGTGWPDRMNLIRRSCMW